MKTAAFDLQLNPAHPSIQFHKLEKPRDRRFWSVRVNSDVRLIVHRSENSLLICYVGHHDNAYQWAERRKLETHPRTGAAQLVEVRETVQEFIVPKYVEGEQQSVPKVATPLPALFASVSEDELLGYGVPAEWLADVRRATEDTLLELAEHLPGEAVEALLDLATGATPKVAKPVNVGADPFAHPDAQRRFRVVRSVEELKQTLDQRAVFRQIISLELDLVKRQIALASAEVAAWRATYLKMSARRKAARAVAGAEYSARYEACIKMFADRKAARAAAKLAMNDPIDK